MTNLTMWKLFKKDNSPEGQCNRILHKLESQEYAQLPEIMKMGIANHTARITQLRHKGHNIECTKWWDNDSKTWFSKYKLIK